MFARKAPSYTYVFGYPLGFDGWENETFCNGHVCHATELPYTFESAWVNFTDTGRRISANMATYWTNFAKTQDPNLPTKVPIVWPKATNNEEYLYFQDPLQILHRLSKNQLALGTTQIDNTNPSHSQPSDINIELNSIISHNDETMVVIRKMNLIIF
ncbi:unnamed protein product [Rotaria sordida]|uniref:Carboxylesterase type B domain-containing protein n=1 Tax=Rotaria sordida TaxID=392033 RepID=A0A819SAW3_9BILA|nr:unnamed protein product [Rotaria sordida]